MGLKQGFIDMTKIQRVLLVIFVIAGLAAVRGTSSEPLEGQESDDGVMMIPVEGEGANYWPRWRGPSGQGLVNEDNYPDTWSDTENVLWRTSVPGTGNSSPIVWGERIFLTAAHDGGQRLSLMAFSRDDGTMLWESFAPDGRAERVHRKNGHASATPTTDGERIYVSFGERGLAAFDMDGELLWHQDLGRLDNYWGTAGSPLLYKDRIIVYQDISSNSFVAAFDKETGEEIWLVRRNASVGWGSPIAIRVDGHDEIIVHGQHRVMAYDPEDGSEIWSCDGSTFEVIPTPVVGYGMLFCSSGRAGPTLAIRPGGEGDVTDTHLVWTSPRGSPFVPSPILYEDQLYIVNDMASIVTSFSAESGDTLFQGRLGVAQREGFSASPIAFGGKVFFTNDNGQTFVLRAGPEFEILHMNEIGERMLASPAMVDGRWYMRTESSLLAIGE